jgi:hypothetical protein
MESEKDLQKEKSQPNEPKEHEENPFVSLIIKDPNDIYIRYDVINI